MDDLLGDFVAETLESLEALSGEVIAWEAAPDNHARLDAFFRFFHTVKGSCGFLDLPRPERLAHAAEDVLAAIRFGTRSPDPVTISAVLAIMDRIGEIARGYAGDLPQPPEGDDDMLIAALSAAPLVGDASPAANYCPVNETVGGGVPRTVRLPLSLIDQLMSAVSDMVLSRNELSRKLRDHAVDPAVDGSFERLSVCIADMRDMVSKTRMQRVDRLFAPLPRMVRDLCRDLGKQASLILEGGDVEMDREMIEMVVDPLTHIVRNAIDHGIEAPADRAAAGKPDVGRIRISAGQSGNQIVIEIADDGRGIRADDLVARALRLGLVSDADVAGLSHDDKLALIFHPGLSTAERLSAISGRGVGMDVVRTNVERIGGVVTLGSAPGRGTMIRLRVPMTLTIIPGLILRSGGEFFAMPRANVVELLHDNSAMVSIEEVAGARVATVRGHRHALVDLEELVGRAATPAPDGAPRTLMIVNPQSGIPYALGVEAVENHEELVIRPASPPVMAAGIFAGITLPDNGRPMLLLDPVGIAQVAELPQVLKRKEAPSAVVDEAQATVAALHFVEMDGEQRLIALDTIERIEDVPVERFGMAEGSGFVRLRGRLVPVANPGALSGTLAKILHLRVAEQELCYVVREVVDIIDMPERPDLCVRGGTVAGVVSLDGLSLQVLDAHALFATLDMGKAGTGTCLVSGLADDPWMRTILGPLLVQAGYDVRDAGSVDGVEAFGPAVLLCDSADHVATAMLPTIRLRMQADADEAESRSIYRYDRVGLLAAIEGALKGQCA
ncbi:MAG: chemotaxis protein CheW [Sphingobium sp.]